MTGSRTAQDGTEQDRIAQGRTGAREILALLYHELRPEPAAYSYSLPASEFAAHVALCAELQRTDAAGCRPVLTFDDGHVSNYEFALPILQQHGQTAHFFITAGWTGRRAGYMDAAQLRALHAAGQHIGAHGWSHTLLPACSPAQLREELDGAKSALEDTISAPVTSLSLPGGRSNAAVLRACREAGYTTVWTSVPQATLLPQHVLPTSSQRQAAARSQSAATDAIASIAPLQIGRYNILGSATVPFLRTLLDPTSGVLRAAERKHRIKAAAQRLLGDRLYARLWAALNHEETPEAAATATGAVSEHSL